MNNNLIIEAATRMLNEIGELRKFGGIDALPYELQEVRLLLIKVIAGTTASNSLKSRF